MTSNQHLHSSSNHRRKDVSSSEKDNSGSGFEHAPSHTGEGSEDENFDSMFSLSPSRLSDSETEKNGEQNDTSPNEVEPSDPSIVTTSDIISSSENGSAKLEKNKRRAKRKLVRADFERVIHLTQRDAARELDVCLSSFKRQLRGLRPKLQWPRKSGYRQKIIVPKHDVELQSRLSNVIEASDRELFSATPSELDSNIFGKGSSRRQLSSADPEMSAYDFSTTNHIDSNRATHQISGNGGLFDDFSAGAVYKDSLTDFVTQDSPGLPRMSQSADHFEHQTTNHNCAPETPSETEVNSPHWNHQYVCFTNHEKWLHHQANILRELQRQMLMYPPRQMSNTGYRGDIYSFVGPWTGLYAEQNTVALSLVDKDLHLLASNNLFQQFTGYTANDFLYGFNISFLHLPTIPREKFVEMFQQLLNFSSINMVEFTTVVEHKSGAFIALHVILHTLRHTKMFWIEYRLAYKFMPKVIFKNSITKKERKTRTIEKPVAHCSRDEMILDDFQTKTAFLRGTEKVRIHSLNISTIVDSTSIPPTTRIANTPQDEEEPTFPDIAEHIRQPPPPQMYSMDELLKEGLEDFLS